MINMNHYFSMICFLIPIRFVPWFSWFFPKFPMVFSHLFPGISTGNSSRRRPSASDLDHQWHLAGDAECRGDLGPRRGLGPLGMGIFPWGKLRKKPWKPWEKPWKPWEKPWKPWEKPWKPWEKPWKPWEKAMKTMGKPKEKHEETMKTQWFISLKWQSLEL